MPRRFRGSAPTARVQPIVDHVVRLIPVPGNGSTIGPHEIPTPLIVLADVITAFMNQAVMPTAQQHRVFQAGLAAIGPVADVVGIHEARVGASGKGAATVSRPQCTLHRRRHRALLAPHVQGLAVGTIHHRHHAAIAAQPLDRLHRQVRAPFAALERCAIHVNHDLIRIGRAR